MDEVTPGASLPRYIQISERLIREIGAGLRPHGSRLPPERDLAAELGVSVGTLRKALAEVEAQGLLERIQGSGNYVRQKAGGGGVYKFFRLEKPDGGGLPTARILDVARQPKPDDLPEFGSGPEAHRIRRVRHLDGAPVALEEIWLDGAQAPRVTAAELSESLYLFYRDTLGLVISRVEDRIGIGTMPDWPGAPPDFVPGTAAGQIDRISWDQAGDRVEVSRTWFESGKARYVSRLSEG